MAYKGLEAGLCSHYDPSYQYKETGWNVHPNPDTTSADACGIGLHLCKRIIDIPNMVPDIKTIHSAKYRGLIAEDDTKLRVEAVLLIKKIEWSALKPLWERYWADVELFEEKYRADVEHLKDRYRADRKLFEERYRADMEHLKDRYRADMELFEEKYEADVELFEEKYEADKRPFMTRYFADLEHLEEKYEVLLRKKFKEST